MLSNNYMYKAPARATVFTSYTHLTGPPFSHTDKALHLLLKVSSLVKPIMRAHHWRVDVLEGFYLDSINLLGLNEGKTDKISLRLCLPGLKNKFLPLDAIVDTLLHEMAHIEISEHGAAFEELLGTLKGEYRELKKRGYSGEGFLGEGRRLGSFERQRDEDEEGEGEALVKALPGWFGYARGVINGCIAAFSNYNTSTSASSDNFGSGGRRLGDYESDD
jgi:hypothetical protein